MSISLFANFISLSNVETKIRSDAQQLMKKNSFFGVGYSFDNIFRKAVKYKLGIL